MVLTEAYVLPFVLYRKKISWDIMGSYVNNFSCLLSSSKTKGLINLPIPYIVTGTSVNLAYEAVHLLSHHYLRIMFDKVKLEKLVGAL